MLLGTRGNWSSIAPGSALNSIFYITVQQAKSILDSLGTWSVARSVFLPFDNFHCRKMWSQFLIPDWHIASESRSFTNSDVSRELWHYALERNLGCTGSCFTLTVFCVCVQEKKTFRDSLSGDPWKIWNIFSGVNLWQNKRTPSVTRTYGGLEVRFVPVERCMRWVSLVHVLPFL